MVYVSRQSLCELFFLFFNGFTRYTYFFNIILARMFSNNMTQLACVDDALRRNYPQIYYAAKYLTDKMLRYMQSIPKSDRSFVSIDATFGKMFISTHDDQTFMSCLSSCLSDKILEHLLGMEEWDIANEWMCTREMYYVTGGRTVRTRCSFQGNTSTADHIDVKSIFSTNLQYVYCSPRNTVSVLVPSTVTSSVDAKDVRHDDFDHYLTRFNVKIEKPVEKDEILNLIVETRLVRISGRRRFSCHSRSLPGIQWCFDLVYSWQGVTLQDAMENFEQLSPRVSFECHVESVSDMEFDEETILCLFSSLLLKMQDFIVAIPSTSTLRKMQLCNVPVFYPVE